MIFRFLPFGWRWKSRFERQWKNYFYYRWDSPTQVSSLPPLDVEHVGVLGDDVHLLSEERVSRVDHDRWRHCIDAKREFSFGGK